MKMLIIYIKLYLLWVKIRDFFVYKIRGAKTPHELAKKQDPYEYGEND